MLDDATGRLGVWWRVLRLERDGLIASSIGSIGSAILQSVRAREAKLAIMRSAVAGANPRGRTSAVRARIDTLLAELALRTSGSFAMARRGVDGAVRAIEGLHPRSVLKRGYTFCTIGEEETIAGRVGAVEKQIEMMVHFYDGGARCRVVEKRKGQSWRKNWRSRKQPDASRKS
jgi:exonuclease VII large subunit